MKYSLVKRNWKRSSRRKPVLNSSKLYAFFERPCERFSTTTRTLVWSRPHFLERGRTKSLQASLSLCRPAGGQRMRTRRPVSSCKRVSKSSKDLLVAGWSRPVTSAMLPTSLPTNGAGAAPAGTGRSTASCSAPAARAAPSAAHAASMPPANKRREVSSSAPRCEGGRARGAASLCRCGGATHAALALPDASLPRRIGARGTARSKAQCQAQRPRTSAMAAGP
mmetsp:Transcript_116304/g.324009  ORF Transcript_116304/g.324009 Transcript_116304/m.324009 type:complete len:223 (+) Transcript_116304:208-876(+)